MSVQSEYEDLVEKVVKAERVGVPAAKQALHEVMEENYGGATKSFRYKAFTQLNEDELARAKKYLSIFLQSTRFRGEYPELAEVIFERIG